MIARTKLSFVRISESGGRKVLFFRRPLQIPFLCCALALHAVSTLVNGRLTEQDTNESLDIPKLSALWTGERRAPFVSWWSSVVLFVSSQTYSTQDHRRSGQRFKLSSSVPEHSR